MKNLLLYIAVSVLCGPALSHTVEKTLATVNGEMITLLDLKEGKLRLKNGFFNSSSLLSLFSPQALQKKDSLLLKFLVYQMLLTQFGKEKNISPTPVHINREIEARRKTKNLSQKAFSRFLVRHHFTPDSYKNFLSRFLIQEQVIQTEIIQKIHISDQDLNQYSLSTVGKVLFMTFFYSVAYISSKSRNQIPLLKQHWSQSPLPVPQEKPSQDLKTGVFHQLSLESMNPALRKTLKPLTVGDVSEPVLLPSGYHVFKVLSKRPVLSKKNQKDYQRISKKFFKKTMTNKLTRWLKDRQSVSFVDIKHL